VKPEFAKRIHLVGVAGTGMGSFAGMLKTAGYTVTGSDENVYPPMSDMLRLWGIPAMSPYRAENLDEAKPDLVIIGNVVRRVNPEATEVRNRKLPQMSFPAALGSLFLDQRHSIVVAGTHGKTTTASLMAHVLVAAGKDPSFLVGGVTQNYSGNYRIGQGAHFVVEGDEYDTAYFDKGPKFLHYRPKTVILTSVEFDHADIYRDLAHYESSFSALAKIVPQDGTIAVSVAYPNAVKIAQESKAKVVTYSGHEGSDADYAVKGVRFGPEGASFEVLEKDASLGRFNLPMGGLHNVENAMGVVAASRAVGLSPEQISVGFKDFQGVRRRQEVRAEVNGITIIDDFAHHPTAVRETIPAICGRYPGRPVWAIFEPRSNTSRRNIHQEEYAHAFTGAARVNLKVPDRHDKVPESEALNVPKLVEALNANGIPAEGDWDVHEILRKVVSGVKTGDVLLVMSNGSFGGLIDKIIAELKGRAS
jgi:UDP-N-acetylmuramate: L-alanyl-gamma-D-glutamyl-meso-diaminopimelate ligase